MVMHTPRLDLKQSLPAHSRFLHISHQDIILNEDNAIGLFDRPLVPLTEHNAFHLGYFHQSPIILLDVSPGELMAHRRSPIKQHLMQLDPEPIRLICSACQCLNFHKQTLFCGSCGHPTQHSKTELAKQCGQCGRITYPQYSPAVLILIEQDDAVLLARSPHFPKGMYSTLAGFIDPGESAEQTVAREALEEVAIKVSDIRYFGTQNWPFPASYMIGYRARYDSGSIVCQPEEIEDAKWFRRDELDSLLLPVETSLSRQLIEAFRRGQ